MRRLATTDPAFVAVDRVVGQLAPGLLDDFTSEVEIATGRKARLVYPAPLLPSQEVLTALLDASVLFGEHHETVVVAAAEAVDGDKPRFTIGHDEIGDINQIDALVHLEVAVIEPSVPWVLRTFTDDAAILVACSSFLSVVERRLGRSWAQQRSDYLRDLRDDSNQASPLAPGALKSLLSLTAGSATAETCLLEAGFRLE